MSATSAKVLEVAAEILGGNAALAARLGIEEWLLCSYLSDRRELPDALLLRAVDIVLADSLSRQPDLHGVPQVTENTARGSGGATIAGEPA